MFFPNRSSCGLHLPNPPLPALTCFNLHISSPITYTHLSPSSPSSSSPPPPHSSPCPQTHSPPPSITYVHSGLTHLAFAALSSQLRSHPSVTTSTPRRRPAWVTCFTPWSSNSSCWWSGQSTSPSSAASLWTTGWEKNRMSIGTFYSCTIPVQNKVTMLTFNCSFTF